MRNIHSGWISEAALVFLPPPAHVLKERFVHFGGVKSTLSSSSETVSSPSKLM